MFSLTVHQNPVKPEEQRPDSWNLQVLGTVERPLLPQPQLEPKLYLLFRPALR